MRSLIWKEWRQNWLVFVLGLAFVLVFPAVYAAHPRHLYMSAQDVPAIQYMMALFYALLVGSTLVAPEIASGTIGELFSRPVNPWKVWLSKLLFGLLTTAVVLVVAELAGAIVAARGLADSSVSLAAVFLLPATVLAVSLFTSTLTEQPILAMVGGVIVMAALVAYSAAWTVLVTHFGGLREYARVLISSLAALIALAVFLALSGLLFARGQIHTGLRGPKWRLAGLSLGCIAVLSGIALFCGYGDMLYLGPHENYEIEMLSASPDGTRVAIMAHAKDSYDVTALWMLDLQSGKRLFPDVYLDATQYWHYYGDSGAWSPDSKRFAMRDGVKRFTFRHGLGTYGMRIKLLDMDTETVRVLRSFQPGGDWPWGGLQAWSDLGDLLYYVVREDMGRFHLEEISLDGTVRRIPIEARNIFPRQVVSAHPPVFLCHYPDPQPPLQYSDRRRMYALVNAATGDSKVIDLGPYTEIAAFLDISPDARYVAYAKYTQLLEREEVPFLADKPPVRLFLKDLSTGADKPVLKDRTWPTDSFRGRINLFSPDGRRFALYISHEKEEPERRELYVVDIEQDSATKLMEFTGPDWLRTMRWSPNGGHVAVLRFRHLDVDPRTGRRRYQSELTVFRPDGTKVGTLTVDAGSMMAFEWLSDDELLYADGRTVYRIKADGTSKTKVFPP